MKTDAEFIGNERQAEVLRNTPRINVSTGCGCMGPLAFLMLGLMAWMIARDLTRLENRIDNIERRTFGNTDSKLDD